MNKQIVIRGIILLGVLLGGLSGAFAQGSIGVRGGLYMNAGDFFIGGELLFPVAPSFYCNPNFEYVFVSSGKYYTINADFHFDFLPSRGPSLLWLGGGFALLVTRPGDTRAGANILFGAGITTFSGVILYTQAKAILSRGNDDLVVGIGVRF